MSITDQSSISPNTCALELLEPELQRNILLQAATLSELHTLIEASPRLYQVFSLNKTYILSTRARWQFHPTVYPEALVLAKLSQLSQPLSRETALAYCDIDACESHDQREAFTTQAESIVLIKLANNIHFFIEDYTRNTIPIMKDIVEFQDIPCSTGVLPEYWPEKPVLYSELSETEVGRLQRAFCRFEIYRTLFAECSVGLDYKVCKCGPLPHVSPSEQAKLYLEKFPDYQIVEINCVRDYLFRRLRGICTQLEDKEAETLPPEALTFDEEDDVEAEQWHSGLFLFTESGKAEQAAHLEHLMSLGLPYIRRIFESSGEQRRALFLRYTDSSCIRHLNEWNFISEALQSLGLNPARVDRLSSSSSDEDSSMCLFDDDEIKPDTELAAPAAWSWAHPRGSFIRPLEHTSKGLRDWGYVFWDSDRLERSGILERTSHNVRRGYFSEYQASTGPSVQQRLLKPLSIWYLGIDSEPTDEPWEDWSEDMYNN